MIDLTIRDIEDHRSAVPWKAPIQVEQDLLLSLSMIAIFNDGFVRDHVAMRGGTVLHKVHLAPPARYSEDIDLVAITNRNENEIEAGLKRVLRPVLGNRARPLWTEAKLAIRNRFRPSRILRIEYDVPSIVETQKKMTLKIEVNVTERDPFLAPVALGFSFPFRGKTESTELRSFDINEMLGTKMRALFQREHGRDLFDLYHAKDGPGVDLDRTISAFMHYMGAEGKEVRRAEFLAALEDRLKNPAFGRDMDDLLRDGLTYDLRAAGDWAKGSLIGRMAE